MAKPQRTNPLNPDWFWEHLDTSDKNTCWEWPRTRTKSGYGRVFIHPNIYYAHRIAWELVNGNIPHGLLVCHHCDNPPCCNPSHLFIGTCKDNQMDSSRKGRTRNGMIRGTQHKLAKLTEKDVEIIRKSYSPGISGKPSQNSIKGLAKKYGVAHSLIYRIIKGISWPM